MKKNILAIVGSASKDSANERLIAHLAKLMYDDFVVSVFNDLKTLPHFDPARSSDNPPAEVIDFREKIAKADGVIICTPEYIFSIPSGLKNAIEWCVATTIFSDKPIGLITASANGQKGHDELQLIMRTVMAKFVDDTALLIPGIKGKINVHGDITDHQTLTDLTKFVSSFKEMLK